MNVAICDDNAQDTELICALIQEHFNTNEYVGELHTFASGEALVEAFAAHPFDAVFLDIYMDGMNGVKTAEKLREMSRDFALVFITVSEDHVLDCISLGTDGYVVKPIKRDSIEMAFSKCRDTFLKNGRYINVLSDRSTIKVPVNKIIYVETYGRETLFHTTYREIRSTATMLLDELAQTLGGSFLRCHRSYIVNMNHVAAIQPEDFRMRDGSLVPLRQRGRAELRDAYADFISDRLFEASS